MKALTWMALVGAMGLIACGGSTPPEPASAEEGAPAENADDSSADPAAADTGDAESAPPAEAEPAGEEAAADSAAEETVAEEEAPAEDEGPPPSSDLQAYMGGAPATPEYKTVQENMKMFKFCYLDALRSAPDIQGEIRVRFTVNKAGKVPKVKVTKNELNAEVETCIIKNFKKLKFPKRDSKRTVEYPFKFIPAP